MDHKLQYYHESGGMQVMRKKKKRYEDNSSSFRFRRLYIHVSTSAPKQIYDSTYRYICKYYLREEFTLSSNPEPVRQCNTSNTGLRSQKRVTNLIF